MKKIFLVTVAMALFSVAGFSQTKKIAHRSHSGKDNTFSIFGPDNFGETPEMIAAAKKREEEKRRQDSIAQRAAADSIAQLNKHPKKNKKKTKH